jgi:hypothetical protein
LVDVGVADGVLHARGQGPDPILELTSPLDVRATARQVLEIQLRASHAGTAEIFYSNTTEGRFGGFSQDKSLRFAVLGDNRWHTYRLLPFWQGLGRIVRLRFDPLDAATFDLDWLRILEYPDRKLLPRDGVPKPDCPEFEFPAAFPYWYWFETVSPALQARRSMGEGLWLGPAMDFAAEDRAYASLSLTVAPASGPVSATLHFATTQAPGLASRGFPVIADGKEHVYHLDLLGTAAWRGRVLALGLTLPEPSRLGAFRGNPAAVQATKVPPHSVVHWLKVADEPLGPARIDVVSFGPDIALPRAGTAFPFRAVVANGGGSTVPIPKAALRLPPGIEIVAGPIPDAATNAVGLGFGDETGWTWTLRSAAPLRAEAVLRLETRGVDPVEQRCSLDIAARRDVPASAYVPPPQPVRGPTEVGVYYFPGWKTASQWQPIRRYPERRPVLGWYREGDPEVADWHIKWAVEHGITFFAYDWYWSQGTRQLEHALHDGLFRARYRHLLKFCLLWANHNAPGTSTPDDCEAVTRYWIEQYFRRPEYLRVDDRPVVIIFSTDRLDADLGAAAVKSAFDAMRRCCREAGLKDLYLVACVGEAGQARQAAAEGYDAVTAYNWPGLGVPTGQLVAPFETLLPGYRERWRHILDLGQPTLWLPICGGWDSRPWHGDNNLVRFGRTPDLFRRHLLDARALLPVSAPAPAAATSGTVTNTAANLVLIEAWNEFGEGSYIEPHQEFGFGYLDAIRDVFSAAPAQHVDLVPADVGLGPYDVPPSPPSRTDWDFTRDDAGWSNLMDLADADVVDGALTARTTGNDPALFGPPFQARAPAFAAVRVRLKLTARDGRPFRDQGQLFWRTSRLAESEASSERFEVIGDGQWHEYTIPVAANRRWRGWITRLRLDPVNQRDITVSVSAIRLMPKTG